MGIRYASDDELRSIRSKGMTVPKSVATTHGNVATIKKQCGHKTKSHETAQNDSLIKFRLPSALRDRFNEICAANKENPSAVIRDLIRQYVDASD